VQQPIRISTPLEDDTIRALHVGGRVLISGQVYTARDAAHHRLVNAIHSGEKLPIPLEKQVIYYVGPSPSQPGQIIGAAGPTTSSRMDSYTPMLIEHGLRGMIGKGKRDAAVREALAAHHAIYFAAVGGAAALIAQSIKAVELIAYEDLGTEAIRLLTIEDFPVVVANDIYGADLYEQGKISFQRYGKSS